MNILILIEIYTIEGNDVIKEVDITHVPFKKLNNICPPEIDGDFQYTNGVYVEYEQYLKLKEIIPEIKKFDFEKYDFNIFSYQI